MGRADGSLVLTDPFFADGPNLYGSLHHRRERGRPRHPGRTPGATCSSCRMAATGPFEPDERRRMEDGPRCRRRRPAPARGGRLGIVRDELQVDAALSTCRSSRTIPAAPYGGRMRRPVLVLIVLVVAALGRRLHVVRRLRGSPRAAQQASTRGVKHVPVPKAARAVGHQPPRPRDRQRDAGELHRRARSCGRSRQGGVITFACGPDPVVIAMRRTAKVVNAREPRAGW